MFALRAQPGSMWGFGDRNDIVFTKEAVLLLRCEHVGLFTSRQGGKGADGGELYDISNTSPGCQFELRPQGRDGQMKKVLLGSGGFRTSVRLAFMIQAMKQHLGGDIRSMLFIPYALKDHDAYLKTMHSYGLDAGYELKSIHLEPDPVRAVQEAEAIFVGGGNTFRLLKQLQTLGLVDLIRKRVLEEGTPYIGISAGSNVACPTIKTTNDMPIVECPSLNAMGLVDFQINAHYYQAHVYIKAPGDTFIEHLGETRNERLSQYLEECDIPVVGLPEGGVLKCYGDAVEMLAPEGEKMTVLRRNSPPYVLEGGEGVDLAGQLLREPPADASQR